MNTRPHNRATTSALGFTLIEVLVALGVVALMAIISWRGLSSIMHNTTAARGKADTMQVMSSSLNQWRIDLDRMVQVSDLPAWSWDGKTFRATRLAPMGLGSGSAVTVVAWSVQRRSVGNTETALYLSRWQSDALQSNEQWQQAWTQAQWWGQQPTSQANSSETTLFQSSDLQLFVFRGNSWSNPLSSDDKPNANDQPANPGAAAVPSGLRLVLSPQNVSGVNGELTLDWISLSFTGSAQ